MSAKNKDLACQRMREFVIATRTLIDEEGEGALSIRRIAEIAGYHNSTIFLYFKDLDALLALVSIGYLSEYNSSLASLSQKRLSALRYFYEIWESFCLNVFQHIELSRRFFYGKYRDKLTQFFILYYHNITGERKAYRVPKSLHPAPPDRTKGLQGHGGKCGDPQLSDRRPPRFHALKKSSPGGNGRFPAQCILYDPPSLPD